MSKIIKIKTWSCECGYKQDFEPTDELMMKNFNRMGNLCPSCKTNNLSKEMNIDRKITMTIIDEEDIEAEIQRAKDGRKTDIDISTPAKEAAYRAKRLKDMVDAIKEAKKYE